MPTRKCFVCNNLRQDAKLHYFPVRHNNRKKWLECINSEVLKTYSNEKLRNLTVCQIHFEKRFVHSTSRLAADAYPSSFTPEEISTGRPNVPFEDISDISAQPSRKRHSGHTYSKNEEPKAGRFCDPVSTCSAAAQSLVAPTHFAKASTSFQAKDPVSTCSAAAQSLVAKIPFAEASTSFQADDPVATCSAAAQSLVADKLFFVKASASIQAEGPVSTLSATAQSLMAETPSFPEASTRFHAEGKHLAVLKTPRASRKRLITRLSDLTPKCSKLYKEYSKAKKQVDFLKRAKRALKFSKENSFEDYIKHLNPYAKKILHMQVRLCTKSKQAYRFSESEKLIALSVMKQSPKCYRFLQKIFIMPSKSTLNKMISQLNVEVGINPAFLEIMKNEITSWDENKKFCSILFDEMHLTEGLNYAAKKDEIEGFIDVTDKRKDFADQALVFMLRGAVWKWQQPFAFYFCKGATTPAALKDILKKVVAAAIDIGLKPVATVCDQGTTFRRALQELQEETRREQILADQPTDETVAICGLNLSVIYDPSHLIKGFRNNFLNKSIVLDGHISKWQDIVDVYLTDCNHAESRLLHKLNDHHVIPDKITNRKKMKVKTAAHVFSTTVSAALSYTAQFSHYADGRKVSETMENTSKTVKFFDQLFDSINGTSTHHKKTSGKKLKKAVTVDSDHHSFWREAITKLEGMKFVDDKGNTISVPTLKSCITTLKSFMRLWQFFQGRGLTVMRPRYFNSDPVENFFGQVRAYNFRHNDPDCHSFSCTYKSLLITRLMSFHSESYNCEDDQTDQLLKLSQILKLMSKESQCSSTMTTDNEMLLEEVEPHQPEVEPGQSDHSHSGSVDETVNEARRERLAVHSRTYTAGWVVRKILKKSSCEECKKKLITDRELPIHNWVSPREFQKFNKKRLIYPSEQAVRCFGTVMEETNIFLEKNPHMKLISKTIVNEIKKKHVFDIGCPEHQTDQFLSIVTKFTIHNWCTTINKILKGTDTVRLQMRKTVLPEMQKKALEVYKKKLKYKQM